MNALEIIDEVPQQVIDDVSEVLEYLNAVSENIKYYISSLLSVNVNELASDIPAKIVNKIAEDGYVRYDVLLSYAGNRALSVTTVMVGGEAALLSMEPPVFPHMNILAGLLLKRGYTPIAYVRREPVLEGIIPFVRAARRVYAAVAHPVIVTNVIDYVAKGEAQLLPLPLDLMSSVTNTSQLWYTGYGLSELKRAGSVPVDLSYREELNEAELSEFEPLTKVMEVIFGAISG